MTPPPLNIDGSQVSEVTIDGDSVSQVTIDGQEVLSAIPDKENLQADWDPEVAFADSFNDGETITGDWSEAEGRTADATVNGDPTYQTDELNGRDAVAVDADGDYFDTALNPDTTQPRSVYAVVQWNSTSGIQFVYGTFESGGDGNRFYATAQQDGAFLAGYGDTAGNGGTVPAGYYVQTAVYGGGAGEIWEDDTSETTISYSGVGEVSNAIDIGQRGDNNEPANANIVRILDYQADHDSQTRQDVWDYLNSEYGVF